MTEDGHRLKPQVTEEETSRTITAAGNLLSPVPPRTPVPVPPFLTRSQLEFAPGQAIVRTPAGSAGNPSAMTVSRVILDPILGTAGQPGCLETSTNQVEDESGVFALADDGSFDYLPGVRSLLRGEETYTFPEVEMVIQPAGKLGLSMARKTDGVSAITHVLVDFLGLVPSTEYEPPNAELWHHGWRSDGEKPALDAIEKVSLSSLSVDDAPLMVGFSPDGNVEVRGVRLNASADDLSIPEEMVKDVIEESQETIASGVIVRYARNWQVLPPTETLTQPDALLRELRREWRRVEAGDMSSAGVYESSLLRQSDAKRQAEALLQIQQGRIFRIDLYDPVPDSLIHIARFGRRATIYWNKNPLFSSGRQGTIVGMRSGVSSLNLFMWFQL